LNVALGPRGAIEQQRSSADTGGIEGIISELEAPYLGKIKRVGEREKREERRSEKSRNRNTRRQKGVADMRQKEKGWRGDKNCFDSRHKGRNGITQQSNNSSVKKKEGRTVEKEKKRCLGRSCGSLSKDKITVKGWWTIKKKTVQKKQGER